MFRLLCLYRPAFTGGYIQGGVGRAQGGNGGWYSRGSLSSVKLGVGFIYQAWDSGKPVFLFLQFSGTEMCSNELTMANCVCKVTQQRCISGFEVFY